MLKDGAAATYGSDAIGGVVNFITRRNWTGIQLNGDYKFVDGSNDDYNASACLVGKNFGAMNLLAGFGGHPARNCRRASATSSPTSRTR